MSERFFELFRTTYWLPCVSMTDCPAQLMPHLLRHTKHSSKLKQEAPKRSA